MVKVLKILKNTTLYLWWSCEVKYILQTKNFNILHACQSLYILTSFLKEHQSYKGLNDIFVVKNNKL